MKNRALLLIDFQKGIESPTQQLYRLPAVLDKVNQRIAVYRQHHAPIIFVQHEEIELPFGSDSWQLFEKLDAQHSPQIFSSAKRMRMPFTKQI